MGAISCGGTSLTKSRLVGVGCRSVGGNLLGLPFLKQLKHCMSWLGMGAQEGVQENAPAVREV